MYAFLGIVHEKDILKGNFVPSAVLCSSRVGGLLVVDTNQTHHQLPKLLVTELWGHEDMIQRMYERRQKEVEPKTSITNPRRRKGRKRPRVKTRGKVFWFLCDMYGNPTGEAIMVDKPGPPKEEPEGGKLPSELWSEEKYVYPIPTDKKLSLPQHTPPSYHGRGRRIGRKRNYAHPNPFGKGEKE